jgi:hypothetical protein
MRLDDVQGLVRQEIASKSAIALLRNSLPLQLHAGRAENQL